MDMYPPELHEQDENPLSSPCLLGPPYHIRRSRAGPRTPNFKALPLIARVVLEKHSSYICMGNVVPDVAVQILSATGCAPFTSKQSHYLSIPTAKTCR